MISPHLVRAISDHTYFEFGLEKILFVMTCTCVVPHVLSALLNFSAVLSVLDSTLQWFVVRQISINCNIWFGPGAVGPEQAHAYGAPHLPSSGQDTEGHAHRTGQSGGFGRH